MVWEVSYRLVLNQCSSVSYYSCLLLASQPFNQNQLRHSNQILLWVMVTQETLRNFKPSQLLQQRESETSAPPLGLWDFGERGCWTSVQQWIKHKHWELLVHRAFWFCRSFLLVWVRFLWNKMSPNFTAVLLCGVAPCFSLNSPFYLELLPRYVADNWTVECPALANIVSSIFPGLMFLNVLHKAFCLSFPTLPSGRRTRITILS